LFVDDNRNMLEGLQRTLRRQRDEWDIQYAISPAEALKIMDTMPIDLIVTDMRMPEMDGTKLLGEVMKRHPEVIRMVFSGQADSNLTMRAVGVAHQFISKPCDPEILKSIVNRAISLRLLLNDSNLATIISEMDTLPSVPALYIEMVDELQSPEPSIQKVGQIIARDPGMTAKILQLVNSAFFGLRRRVSNPADAVSYVGLERVQQLFLAIHAFSRFTPAAAGSFSMELLWKHSLSTAAFAKAVAREEEPGTETAEDAFTAGLLHDIGKLMLACRLGDRHAEAINLAKMKGMPLWAAEQQVLSVTHAEVGAYLLGLWGLPDSIVEAVAYHHRPTDCANKVFCALTALHAADHQNSNQCYAGVPASQPSVEYLSKLLRKTRASALNASPILYNSSDSGNSALTAIQDKHP
jgi:putative nucleotidyltransferase with HDIG domain